ncbi:hypothetical protein CB1_001561007 [Camelus ferus]|nr:hypothetical protein CB1_001561007 [Camelus ferus]
MRSLDLASQQLALRGKNRLAPGDRPEHTELPHLQIGTLLPRSLLQLAFSQSAMATSGSSAGIRWSRQETRTLLSILGEAEYIQRLQTVHHNADVYQAVSKRMQQEGFRRTERQCRSKFKVLKALYLKAYVAHATSMGDPPHCPFYDTLDQLLRNQIVTDPDPDNLMEEAAWPKHCDQNLTASDTPGQEGTSILGAKRTQAADHSPALQTVKESDEDCQLRNSDQMQEASDLEDSWDESSGAGKVKGSRILKAMTLGCSQGTPSYSSSHHLFRGAVAPCQSSPMTRLGVSAELAENRRLARELSKREEEKLDRLIAIGEVASAQQDIANELRRDAVVAVIEKNGKLRYEIDTGGETKFVNPEDVARLIFSKMKETAHSVLGSDANDVVITVPFDFGEKQKSALGNILVFKLGGTSLSISVMEVNSGIYRVLSTNTDNIGADGESEAKLPSAVYLNFSLSVRDHQTLNCMNLDLKFDFLILQVVLCGGSSRIPRLQQMIKDLFPAVELLNSIPPDEVIPIGAATEAGILIGKENPLVEDSLKIECSTKDILVKVVLQDLDKKENGLRDILAVLTMKRIVQKGTQYSLCIFRTSNGCGWGVKTLVKIKRMTFVMEYVGECDPNLQVFNVFIDNLDTRLPRIALFSTRTIHAGEELTFDYQMKVDETGIFPKTLKKQAETG